MSQAAREWVVSLSVLVGSVAVFAIWAIDSIPSQAFGNWATSVGRVTGLEGTYFVLVTVLFLARVWWIERLVGMDRLGIWHRRVGQLAIWLLVAHTFLIILGYSSEFHSSLAGETKTVVLNEVDMLAATLGLVILIVVSIVSVRVVRRRVTYQAWYFIHLYVYLAIALSFAHQLATGSDFTAHPANREIWIALYATVFGLLLWYRVLIPLRSHRRHRLKVFRVVEEAERSVSIYIIGDRLSAFGAESGQFFIWRFLTRDGWWQAHPFSLSAPPDGTALRLTVRASGDFTETLDALTPGTKVIAEGPFGGFTVRQRRQRKVLLVAAGAGISPVRALFETIPARPGDITLIYRARDESQLALRAELDAVAATRGARVVYMVGSREEHEALFDAVTIRSLLWPDPEHFDAFVCGPSAFMDRMVGGLKQAGLPSRHIHTERFDLSR